MKVYTDEQKIEEINLGIRLEKMKIKDLELKKSNAKLCDRLCINLEIGLIDNLIENMYFRIEELKLVW